MGDETPPSSRTDPSADPATLHPNEETSAHHGRDTADGASATDLGTAAALTNMIIVLDT